MRPILLDPGLMLMIRGILYGLHLPRLPIKIHIRSDPLSYKSIDHVVIKTHPDTPTQEGIL